MQPPTHEGPDCVAVLGLAAKDFRVFEDGVEQRIESVSAYLPGKSPEVRDTGEYHLEEPAPQLGKWISRAWSSPTALLTEVLPYYEIAYVPPVSREGTCHRVKVKVNRRDIRDIRVSARSEYCNVEHAPNDSLKGTKFGSELEHLVLAKGSGSIPLSAQVNLFPGGFNANLVDIAVGFPWKSIRRYPKRGNDYDIRLGILGAAYAENGSAVARFSDLDSGGVETFSPPSLDNSEPSRDVVDPSLVIPEGYEAQITLPPGHYALKIVLSDGSKFGRVEVPLDVESYAKNELVISSVALCRSFLTDAQARPLGTSDKLAPHYVPLDSMGTQFTPAGDTRFKKGEPLIAYFEVYEPLLATDSKTRVQVRLKITNQQTGEVKTDTGYRPADSWVEPGSSTIHIAENIARDQLPSGSYRLEVQASDSTGRSTTWRGAAFTVE